jgi:hypothetical protein
VKRLVTNATTSDTLVGAFPCELETGHRADQVEGAAQMRARRARTGRDLTVGVKVSGHARPPTCKVVERRAKARTEVHQGQVRLEAVA